MSARPEKRLQSTTIIGVSTPSSNRQQDRAQLDRAARLAWRGLGDVEPNPPVGCIIGRIEGGRVRTLGVGHHRRFGGPHAEVEALADCESRGENPAGATVWVTLEPCSHFGKTPPCAAALIKAQVGCVVTARRDPADASSGGAEMLRAAGIKVRITDASPNAVALAEPFARRVNTGLPWVIAKWAQTIDGRVATRTGDSKWISNGRSRQLVHQLRARVDAIIVGVGTAIADDPLLTARGVARIRRGAVRVVIDPRARLGLQSQLAQTAKETPTLLVCADHCAGFSTENADKLREAGVHVLPFPCNAEGRIDPAVLLAHLAREHNAANVMLEGGPNLISGFLAHDLIDEAHVYAAPRLLADECALPAALGQAPRNMSDGQGFRLLRAKQLYDDVLLVYRRAISSE